MAFTNLETREINCKVLYLGPQGSGKTANFQSIYCERGLSLSQDRFQLEPEKSPFFEFLPLSLGYLKDFQIKLHLYTMTLSPLYKTVLSTLIKGVDGVVFVYDSRFSALEQNMNCWRESKELFSRLGQNLIMLPKVLQYNKRDHQEALPLELLRHELNPGGLPEVEATATRSQGTLETVQSIARAVLDQLGEEGVQR
ncbi:MAG: GTP-binding protein [Oligoflexus sp.]